MARRTDECLMLCGVEWSVGADGSRGEGESKSFDAAVFVLSGIARRAVRQDHPQQVRLHERVLV